MSQDRERDFEVDVEVRTIEKRRVRAASSAEAYLKMNQEGLQAVNVTELPPQDLEQAWADIEALQAQLFAARQAQELLNNGYRKLRDRLEQTEAASKISFGKAALMILIGIWAACWLHCWSRSLNIPISASSELPSRHFWERW